MTEHYFAENISKLIIEIFLLFVSCSPWILNEATLQNMWHTRTLIHRVIFSPMRHESRRCIVCIGKTSPFRVYFYISAQVVDGWELNGEVFPSEMDHRLPLKQRSSEFCGKNIVVKRTFTSSQNAAVIQYRIPKPGKGFTVLATFLKNPRRELSYGYTLVLCPGDEISNEGFNFAGGRNIQIVLNSSVNGFCFGNYYYLSFLQNTGKQ